MSNMQFPRIIFTRMQDPAITQTSPQRALEELQFKAFRIVNATHFASHLLHTINYMLNWFHTFLQI